jgi:hypothetical protein
MDTSDLVRTWVTDPLRFAYQELTGEQEIRRVSISRSLTLFLRLPHDGWPDAGLRPAS